MFGIDKNEILIADKNITCNFIFGPDDVPAVDCVKCVAFMPHFQSHLKKAIFPDL